MSSKLTVSKMRRISVALHPLRGPKLVDTLRATGAGKTVQSLSRAKDKEVSRIWMQLGGCCLTKLDKNCFMKYQLFTGCET